MSRVTFSDAVEHFETHLLAAGKSKETIESYLQAAKQYHEFHVALGLPDDVTAPTREHIETWLADLAQRVSSASVANRFKGLRALYKWLEAEGEVRESPMAKLRTPKVREKPPKACSVDEVRLMIATCKRDFVGRRDAALIAFMFDTGWRVTETLKVTVEMVRAKLPLEVQGKGGKVLRATLRPPVQELVNRYLRVRESARPELWLTRTGRPMDRHNVLEMLEYRSTYAGIQKVTPHMLRHSHAITWLERGGNLMDLKENLGHSSLSVTERYLTFLAQERALQARQRHGPGDLLA